MAWHKSLIYPWTVIFQFVNVYRLGTLAYPGCQGNSYGISSKLNTTSTTNHVVRFQRRWSGLLQEGVCRHWLGGEGWMVQECGCLMMFFGLWIHLWIHQSNSKHTYHGISTIQLAITATYLSMHVPLFEKKTSNWIDTSTIHPFSSIVMNPFACHDWRPCVFGSSFWSWRISWKRNLQSDEPSRTIESVNLHDFCGRRFIKYIEHWFFPQTNLNDGWNPIDNGMFTNYWLVVWNMAFIFQFFHNVWECHDPNWRTHIFQDGYCTTNQ